MQFMLNAFANEEMETGVPSDPKLVAAITKLADELSKAGVLLAMGGLAPSSKGARVRLSGGKVTVTDGPFAETKEIIGGAWIVEVKTKEEAIELAKQVWQVFADVYGPCYEGEGEVREMFDWVSFSQRLPGH
jgi:hypothetical protein